MADTQQIRKADFTKISDVVVSTFQTRKESKTRRDLEKIWKEVDRQLAMEFDPKIIAARTEGEQWKPELELPMQSEALEILNADGRRLMFPDQDSYFTAHALTTKEYFLKVARLDLIPGENDVPTTIDQEIADAFVEGAHLFFQGLYDYRSVWDQFNAGAFKYGTGVVRARVVEQEKVIVDQRGVIRNHKKVPIIAPVSIKQVFLDDSQAQANMAGFDLDPAVIYGPIKHRITDLAQAAKNGNTDPRDELMGGWRPKAIAKLEGEDDRVDLIEFEGDLVIPRSRDNLIFDNVVVTVAMGTSNEVIRFRFRKAEFRSWITQPYQRDQLGPYGTGPLMKGMPIQKAATMAFNNLMAAGALNVDPPIAYDPSDPHFAGTSGPIVAPRMLWPTLDGIVPQKIGDIGELLVVYNDLVRQFQDMTGVTAPRLGQQTKSHQTATAIESEQQRGQVRTVDYVRTVQHGAQESWLNLEFKMIKQLMTKKEMVYIPRFGFYAEMNNEALPDQASYDVNGVADPAVTFEKEQRKAAAIQALVQTEEMAVQAGATPTNWDNLRRDIVGTAFKDIDRILPGSGPVGRADSLPVQPPARPELSGPAGELAPAAAPALVAQTGR